MTEETYKKLYNKRNIKEMEKWEKFPQWETKCCSRNPPKENTRPAANNRHHWPEMLSTRWKDFPENIPWQYLLISGYRQHCPEVLKTETSLECCPQRNWPTPCQLELPENQKYQWHPLPSEACRYAQDLTTAHLAEDHPVAAEIEDSWQTDWP